MKEKGIIDSYNGKFGTIKMNDEIIDFEAKDISFNETLKIGDTVEFRIEKKFPNIKIARNIKLVNVIQLNENLFKSNT